MRRHTSTDIAVIGAGGAAGTMVLHQLRAQGANAIGLEAMDRHGGRVWTKWKKTVPFPIELGAEFIHSPWLKEVVQSMGLTTVLQPADGLAYANGKFCPLAPVFDLVQKLRRETQQMFRGDEEISMESFLREHSAIPQLESQFGITRHLIEQLIRNDHAARVSELSVSGWMEPDTHGMGKNYRIKEGFSELLTRLAEGTDIRYKHKVSTIRWSPGDVEIFTNKGIFNARRAVVAVPVGVLQNRMITFDPDLPREKWQGIDSIRAGTASKIITSFSRSRSGNIFWPNQVPQVVTSLASQLCWPTGWGYPESDAGQFYISMLVGGAATERFQEDARNTALMQLRHMFGKRVLEQALKTHFSVHWDKEPFIRTGYSWMPTNAGGAARDQYAETMDSTLYFAGEAVGDPEHPGAVASVSGALRSGIAAEKRLRQS